MANPLPQAAEKLRALATEHGIPGVACGLDVGGERLEIHHGVTHVDHPLPVDAGTLFQIASNSKVFTAALVMQLVEQGRLALDDPIRKHLPGFRMPERDLEDAVSVRLLLSHRVGWDGDALFVRQPDPPELDQALAPMARARQLVPPGSHFTYSNAGFTILGCLVEALTGERFEHALGERILAPLGMTRTFARADAAIFHRVAMRHLSRANGDPIALPGGGWQPGWELAPIDLPAGGLISCVDDLMAWLRFWLGRPDEGATPPLSSDTREQMQEEQFPAYNPRQGQALGWAVRHDPAGPIRCHSGVTAGYCSFTFFAPALDAAGVVLTNGTGGGAVHEAFTEWLVGELGGAPWSDPEPLADPPDAGRYLGAYDGSFGIHHVTLDGDALAIATERHSTADGSWQPPPEPPVRARLVGRDHAIVCEPAGRGGACIDFEPTEGAPAWLRMGGRIATRMGGRIATRMG